MLFIYIAQGHYIYAGQGRKPFQVLSAHATKANNSHAYAVASRNSSGSTGEKGKAQGRYTSLFYKLSSLHAGIFSLMRFRKKVK
jgi:hypothetical protein